MRNLFEGALVFVVGALLGSFLGKLIGLWLPAGRVSHLLSTEITAGLHPIHLNLQVLDLTFGCMFHLNMMSLVGIALAAVLYRKLA